MITDIKMNTQLYWRLGSATSKIVLWYSETEQFEFDNALEYMQLVSSVETLKTDVIDKLTINSKFPSVINLQNEEERMFIIPYVLYQHDGIMFNVAIVTKIFNADYYEIKTGKYSFHEDTQTPFFQRPFSVRVVDEKASIQIQGEMLYAFGVQTLPTDFDADTAVMVAGYQLVQG